MSRIIVENISTGRQLLWRHINIKKSLDHICHTLELEIPSSERTKVHRHEKIEVRCENPVVKTSGGKPRVTTVMVDEVTAVADISKNSITVLGRSPARDIIDSAWKGEWKGERTEITLYQIAKGICDKFGIACTHFPKDRDPTAGVPAFSWNNESPWTKLIAEADSQGFLLTSNEAGDLYIRQAEGAPREKEGFYLTEGRNIRSIEWKENGAEQYHEYIVTGGYNPVSVIDDTCKNNRVLTIDLTYPEIDPAKLLRRAQTEKNRRKESRVTVTVPGWGLTDTQIKNNLGGDTDGKEIFRVLNLLIPVSMPSLGLSGNLLTAEVEQEADQETMSSTITLVKRDAYS
jgi:prophage tail gpP-like protein